MYAQIPDEAAEYAEHFLEVDGLRLCPILKYYKIPKEIMQKLGQRILF